MGAHRFLDRQLLLATDTQARWRDPERRRGDRVQRPVALDERVRTDDRPDAEVEHRAERHRPVEPLAKLDGPHVAQLADRAGLGDRGHAQSRDPMLLRRGRERAVLDPVARVLAWVRAQRGLDGVEHRLMRRIAHGVDAQLPAGGVGAHHERGELGGRVIPGPRAAARSESVAEDSRPGGDRAVRVELEAGDPQPIVAQRAHDAEREQRVELVRQRQHAHARTGSPAGVRLQVDRELPSRDLRIADRRDPGRVEARCGDLEHRDALVDRELGMEVRAVMADVDARAQHEVRGRVPDDARGPAAVIPFEGAAGRDHGRRRRSGAAPSRAS